ncbi:hypothetical protein IG631_10378 [Alternaria alternata]|nr:hypothetical protein IG631_10378 [Alternaria alternata]
MSYRNSVVSMTATSLRLVFNGNSSTLSSTSFSWIPFHPVHSLTLPGSASAICIFILLEKQFRFELSRVLPPPEPLTYVKHSDAHVVNDMTILITLIKSRISRSKSSVLSQSVFC